MLAVRTSVAHFSSTELDVLVRYLDVQERATIIHTLDDQRQILLNHEGATVAGNYRLSETAFTQICLLLSSGLSNLLRDLLGQRRRLEEHGKNQFSVDDVVDIFNRLVRRRFDRLYGRQLVRNSTAGIIDGVVGAGYKRLSNFDFVERVRDVIRDVRPGMEFHDADAANRRLAVRFCSNEKYFETGDDEYRAGYYFTNSELGNGSVRVSFILLRSGFESIALGSLGRSSRLIHAGKDFYRRFEKLMSSAPDRRPPADKLAGWANRLRSTLLGFGSQDAENEKNYNNLVQRLVMRQIRAIIADNVVRTALSHGSENEAHAPARNSERRLLWGTRTMYDLFNAMTREARELPLADRERLEHQAYGLLAGFLKL